MTITFHQHKTNKISTNPLKAFFAKKKKNNEILNLMTVRNYPSNQENKCLIK